MMRSIVIADDEAPLRRMIRLMLEQDGRFLVLAEASNGVEALELVDDHDPDLLLLDLGMPVMDGLQVLERLDGRSRPTVVVLTGFADPGIESTARELGASGFLVKGTKLSEITDLLAE